MRKLLLIALVSVTCLAQDAIPQHHEPTIGSVPTGIVDGHVTGTYFGTVTGDIFVFCTFTPSGRTDDLAIPHAAIKTWADSDVELAWPGPKKTAFLAGIQEFAPSATIATCKYKVVRPDMTQTEWK